MIEKFKNSHIQAEEKWHEYVFISLDMFKNIYNKCVKADSIFTILILNSFIFFY